MPGEIVNTLGFDVKDALDALTKLDGLLQQNQTAFEGLAGSLRAWNTEASGTITALKGIVAAAKEAVASLGNVRAPTVAAATGGSSLWLPAGARETAPEVAAPSVASATAAAAATQKLTGVMREAQKVYQDTRTPQEQYNTQVEKLGSLHKAGLITTDTHTRGIKQASTALQDATSQTSKWAVSWETLARVVATQFIVRMMSEVRDLLKEAVAGSLEFQKNIAEIRTIAPGIDQDFNSLSREVANFSKNFNFPLPQVSEALYQTLSNQFTTAGQRADIMTASAELAKVGVMKLNDAVLLITGTLNAYGMSSSQAETVAAKFFKTIELGRIRGEEMSNVIGQLVPIASQVGVSLDEVNSSMVAMTIGGMKTAQAATAIRAGMTALMKPSDDLKKELRELGFESGVQMVRAKGLEETFLALAASVDGDVAKIAQLFRNVRGLNAELRLTGAGAEQAQKALAVMSQTSGELLAAKYKEFTSTSAEAFTKEVNKLKVALSTDIGGDLVRMLNQMMQAAGGADNLVAALRVLISIGGPLIGIIGGVVAAMQAYQLYTKLAAMSTSAFGFALIEVLGPIAIVVGSLNLLDSRLASAFEKADAKFSKQVQEHMAEWTRASEKRLATEEEGYTKSQRALETYLAEARKSYFKQVDDAREVDTELIASSRQTMTQMIAARERVVTAFRNVANQANQAIKASVQEQATLQAKASDMEFAKLQRDRSAQQQFEEERRRGLNLAEEAAKKLSQATSDEDKQAAMGLFQRAEAYLQQSKTKADATSDTNLQKRAEQDLLDLIYQQIDAGKKFHNLKEEQATAAAKMAADEQGRVDRMKVLMKDVLDSEALFTKKGPKDTGDRAKQVESAKASMDELQKLWLSGKKVDMGDLLAFDTLKRRLNTTIEGGVSDVEVKALFAAPETLAKLNHQITGGIGTIEIKLEMLAESVVKGGAAALNGKDQAEVYHIISEAVRTLDDDAMKAKRRQEELKTSIEQTRVSALGLSANNMALTEEMKSAWTMASEAFQKGWNAVTSDRKWATLSENAKQFSTLAYTFQQMGQMPELVNEKQVAELQKMAAIWMEKPQSLFDKQYVEQAMKWAKIVQSENQRREEMQKAEKGRGITDEETIKKADDAKKWLETLGIKLSDAKTSAEGVQTAMSQVPDMSTFTSNLLIAAGAMDSIASSAGYLSGFGGEVMTAATGGNVWDYLAGGGQPRGRDTRAAMLTPGEVVMNERASQRFASQLVAMNAGVRPSFHSEGGSVTNIGDINVTVSGGESSRQTARSIAKELRRELRRGTSTL